jgi:hypothetical protein
MSILPSLPSKSDIILKKFHLYFYENITVYIVRIGLKDIENCQKEAITEEVGTATISD